MATQDYVSSLEPITHDLFQRRTDITEKGSFSQKRMHDAQQTHAHWKFTRVRASSRRRRVICKLSRGSRVEILTHFSTWQNKLNIL